MKIQKWLKVGAKSLAILASAFLAFGAMGCSNDGGSNDKKDETVQNDPSGIDVPALEVTETYSLSAGTLTEAYEDASLYIKFDATPTINASVSVKGDESNNKAVKILKSDGTVVDTIYASAEQITSQASNDSYKTINVKDQLISVNGNVVVIKPHTSLDPSTAYYVTVDDGLLSGKVSGTAFAGISDASKFTFTTRSAPSISGNTITIGKDKNFSKIQSAFDYLADKSGDWTLEIDNGYYNERLSFANAKVNVTMIGVGETEGDLGANTVIYWKNNNGKDGSTTNDGWNPASRTRTAFLYEGGNLTIKHLTFANTISRTVVGKDGTQAEAFYYDATGYLVAYDSSFKSHQDTLLLGNSGGRGWFYKCYIEGDTDFIWGYPDTVLFEECQIRCLYDDAPAVTNHTSYIFASRSIHTANANKGLVLFNSSITVDNGVTAYYGRNSGSDTQAAVVFNKFSAVDSKLWLDAPSVKYDEDIEGVCSVGYKDYGNTYTNGNMIATSSRTEGTYGLSKVVAEREYCGRNAILNRGWDATNRVYKACATQWDLSDFEEEFNASEDASKLMIYVEPTYVPYLEGEASTSFVFKKYDGTSVDASISVDNTELASVSDSSVTALAGKTGEVYVTATSGASRGIARINVIPQIVAATGITLDKTEAFEIDKDDKVTLSAVFTPEDTTDKSITWSSSDTNVLRVTGSGAMGDGLEATVTGFGLGTATITATSTKTPTVSTSVTITVNEVYAARYLQESTGYSLAATIDHRDAKIVANPVSYGFEGDVAVATLSDADKAWGNNGYKFTSNGSVDCASGAEFAWADFTIRAAADIKIKAITADAYCSATINERGIVSVKVGDGDFEQKAEVAADNKAMKFDKVDISTDVAATQTVTVRVAIAMLEGKTQNKAITGVIGGVVIYYDIEGTPVAFPGADGDYNIKDYATDAEKVGQFTAMADGTTADGMISWHNVKYHSENYGLGINTNGATITIKVGGPSVISMVGSQWSGGTITVTTSDSSVIASGNTKVDKDGDLVQFLYTGTGEDTVTITFSGTTYVGTINVKELTTEVAEVKSVKITGAETVSTAAPVKFTAAVEATYMASQEVNWTSSDDTVAEVAADGTVTGKKAGTVTITATSKVDSTKKDTLEVEITEEELKPVVGNTYTYNFAKNTAEDYVSLTAGEAGTSPDTFVSWNEKWKVHGATYGLVNTSKAGATISIKVAGDVVVGFTGYNAASGVMKVTDAGDNVILASMPMKTGNDSTTKEFIYKGEATTLTLTSVSGDCYITTLTVKPWTNEVQSVDSISITGSESIFVGNTATLKAVVTTSYFADESVTWASDNTAIAEVDDDGVVTAKAIGSATITATSVFDKNKSAAKTVTVSAAPSFIATNTYVFQGDGNTGDSYTTLASAEDSSKSITLTGINGHSYGAVTTGSEHYVTIPVDGPTAITVYANYPGDVALKLYNTANTETAVDTLSEENEANSSNACPESGFTVVYTGNSAATLKLVIEGTVYMYQIKVTNTQKYQYVFQGDGNTSDSYTTLASAEDSSKSITLTGIKGHNYGAVTSGSDHYVTIPVTGFTVVTVYANYPGTVSLKLYDAADTENAIDTLSESNSANSSGSCPESGYTVTYNGDGTAENLKLVIEGTVYMYQITINQ